MSGKNDGGQAFPNEGFNGWGSPQQGMTLRDYFAAKAMQAMIEKYGYDEFMTHELAKNSTVVADAMISELSK